MQVPVGIQLNHGCLHVSTTWNFHHFFSEAPLFDAWSNLWVVWDLGMKKVTENKGSRRRSDCNNYRLNRISRDHKLFSAFYETDKKPWLSFRLGHRFEWALSICLRQAITTARGDRYSRNISGLVQICNKRIKQHVICLFTAPPAPRAVRLPKNENSSFCYVINIIDFKEPLFVRVRIPSVLRCGGRAMMSSGLKLIMLDLYLVLCGAPVSRRKALTILVEQTWLRLSSAHEWRFDFVWQLHMRPFRSSKFS